MMGKGINVFSETGKLEAVIIHKPGMEVELMTPGNIKEALYSDLLNAEIAAKEHYQLSEVLRKVTKVYELEDLLLEVFRLLPDPYESFCALVKREKIYSPGELKKYTVEQLVRFLITGKWKDDVAFGEFELPPLYNFYFMRDASVSIGNLVLAGKMAKEVRNREPLIMELIFRMHPGFKTKTLTFDMEDDEVFLEGGDVLVAREDVLFIGNGGRTSEKAILQLAKKLVGTIIKHIVIQQLPKTPESFIHLDMVFTFLDKNVCMIYEEVFRKTEYKTKYIRVEENPEIQSRDNFFAVLKELDFDLEFIPCGGENPWSQKREQWHSGANFFAFAPGKVIGYGRNKNTIEALRKRGFEVIPATEIIKGEKHPDEYARCVVTIDSCELVRGGGGARCMTMPVRRKEE